MEKPANTAAFPTGIISDDYIPKCRAVDWPSAAYKRTTAMLAERTKEPSK